MQTEITRLLGIKYPIIQGGMAWVAEHHLAAAVSEAGGLGLIGAASAPAEWVREQIRAARKLTDKPFGVNIMLMSPYAADVAKVIVEEGVQVVTTGAGSPGKYMEMWKEAGVKVIPVVASVALAKRMERAGADAIVLDVKTGSGAFMKTREDALALAKEMVQLGKNAGRKTIAVVSNMDQPLGNTVGNALEVREAIDTLNGNGPRDFTELVMTLGSYMLLAGGKADKEETARRMLRQVVEDGSALRKLAEFVKAQGGDESYVYEPEKLPCAKIRKELLAPVDGYIQKIVCDEVGICSLILGGGRETKESQIDLSVGIRLIQKVGKYVHKGDVLAEVFANDCQKLEEAMTRLQQAYHIGPDEAKEQNVILDVVK